MPLAIRTLAQAPAPRWLFLGTDTGEGIYRAVWNSASGTLGPIELAAPTERADFLALHPSLPVLYTVNSLGNGKGAVSSFRLNANTGELTPLNRVQSHGDGPCFLSVSADRAYVANYSGGSFAAFALTSDGALQDHNWTLDCRPSACGTLGPVKDRQDSAHLHCATLAPGGEHIVVCDLGKDSLEIFTAPAKFLGSPTRIAARPGSGPRHVAFHPNRKWLYCIHELDCTVDLYDWTLTARKPSLTLRPHSTLSTLTPGTPLTGNTACELIVSDDGRFLYTCTRGTDQLVTFRIDPATGLLTEHQRLSCGGLTPRYIAFDPSRLWLLSCNQATPGSVTVFRNDPATGTLSPIPQTFPANTPMFALWV